MHVVEKIEINIAIITQTWQLCIYDNNSGCIFNQHYFRQQDSISKRIISPRFSS